eukprot:1150010-Pelagomonas_calceolata.AAC.1
MSMLEGARHEEHIVDAHKGHNQRRPIAFYFLPKQKKHRGLHVARHACLVHPWQGGKVGCGQRFKLELKHQQHIGLGKASGELASWLNGCFGVMAPCASLH